MSTLFNTACLLVLGITLPIYLFYRNPEKESTYECVKGNGAHGSIRRSTTLPHDKDLLKSPVLNIQSIYDILLYGVEKFPSKQLFGSRKVLDIIKEEKSITKIANGQKTIQKKTWSFFKLSKYEWLTYTEVLDSVSNIGSGLIEIGLKSNDKVSIFHSTRFFVVNLVLIG
jgi:long-chain acyl-CoA synthetase